MSNVQASPALKTAILCLSVRVGATAAPALDFTAMPQRTGYLVPVAKNSISNIILFGGGSPFTCWANIIRKEANLRLSLPNPVVYCLKK